MTATDRSLLRLARLAGVALRYRDARGKLQRVAPETLRSLLAVMGLETGGQRDVAASIARYEAEEWRALLPPVAVIIAGEPATVPVSLADDAASSMLSWRITLENGERCEGRSEPGGLAVLAERRQRKGRSRRLALPLDPDLPQGYHRMTLAAGAVESEALLIVAPRRCYLPPDLREGSRAWALTAQLYALRSQRNWGIGDFSDLAALAAGVARQGARALGINPLHALFPAEPRHISPYSPSSRLFLNPLYIDVTAAPDFAESTVAQAMAASAETMTRLAAARDSGLVDYPAVASLKRPIFDELHRSFAERHLREASARGAAFRRFQEEGGERLRRFAVFTALHEHQLASRGSFSWQDWPEPLRNARSPAVAAFAAEHAGRVELHEYLQWEADRQLGEAAQKAAAAGLSIGFYRDLAVGVDPSGAEAWGDPAMMVTGASVGAPPDLLNLKGQNWGLAPVNPVALRREAFAPFIAALRANMRHAGVLRIDHVMALMHLYWVPRGASPAEGSYVSYPFAELRHILALESHRQRCAVIGEDLGTVPQGFREIMGDAGVLSYRVLLFERDRAQRFLLPEAYPDLASASFSTHDIPTLKGYWLGRDLEWRRRLDLYPEAALAEKDLQDRRRDRRRLLRALIAARALPRAAAKRLLPQEGEPIYERELAEAVYRFLGRTRSRLVLMQIEDALGESEQVNLPGTIDEHPNWRRKLTLALDQLLHDPAWTQLAAVLGEARRGAETP